MVDIWTPCAPDVPQISDIDLGGTYAAGEQIDIDIGNSRLSILVGTTTTLDSVAEQILGAVNATTLDDATVAGETRLGIGQLLAEFRDVKAEAHPTDTSKVRVRSKVAGTPFGTPGGAMLVATNSASGTIAVVEVQAATGQEHWNNVKNWHDGSVPVSAADIVFQKASRGPKYNCPNNTYQPASVRIDNSVRDGFQIGLEDINTSNGMPYAEYRHDRPRWNNDHSTATRYTIGQGPGPGVRFARFEHVGNDLNQMTGVVYDTGEPLDGESHAVYFACGTTNAWTVGVEGGHVAFAAGADETFSGGADGVDGIQVSSKDAAIGEEDVTLPHVLLGKGCNLNGCPIMFAGGTVEVHCDLKDDGAEESSVKILGDSTEVIVQGDGTAAFPRWDRINVRRGAKWTILSEMTIDKELIVEGDVDLRRGRGKITVTSGATYELRGDGVIDDPQNRLKLFDFTSGVGGGGGSGG